MRAFFLRLNQGIGSSFDPMAALRME
jgi:hypothetical protein